MMTNTSIPRVWAERLGRRRWITGGSNSCSRTFGSATRWPARIQLTPNGKHNSRIVNSTVRNNGDDGFAMLVDHRPGQGETSATCSRTYGSSDLAAAASPSTAAMTT